MLRVQTLFLLKQESVSLVIMKNGATPVIPESDLVQEGILMTPARVETRHYTEEIMETNTSKSWDIFWYTDKENNKLSSKPLLKQCQI